MTLGRKYCGETSDDSEDSDSNSETILQQIQRRARERKRSIDKETVGFTKECNTSTIKNPNYEGLSKDETSLVQSDIVNGPVTTKSKKRTRESRIVEDEVQKSRNVGGEETTDDRKHRKKLKQKRKRERPSTPENKEIKEIPVELTVEASTEYHAGSDDAMSAEDDTAGEDNRAEDDTAGDNVISGFTVIRTDEANIKKKIKRVLPAWLASPDVLGTDLTDDAGGLSRISGLDDDLVEKLKQNGIKHFFPAQRQVIPAILSDIRHGHLIGAGGYRPRDICCSSPTGSGKTLAFVLPIIQGLKSRVVCRIRALVILPVADLAAQVYTVFHTYCQGTKLKVCSIVGTHTAAEEKKMLVSKSGSGYVSLSDIVITTPGRLLHHIDNTQGFNLKYVRFFVIDEADRLMMDDARDEFLSHIEKAVYNKADPSKYVQETPYGNTYENRQLLTPTNIITASRLELPFQKLLFSATLSHDPEQLQKLKLFQPRLFTAVVYNPAENAEEDVVGDFIGKFTTPDGLKEWYMEVSAENKPLYILYILHVLRHRQILCFTNSKENTHRLHLLLNLYGDVNVAEITTTLKAAERASLIKKFDNKEIDILVCSDVLARGIDIDNVECVISYDQPRYIRTYIHRVGRTARAGKSGTSITLIQNDKVDNFNEMLQSVGKQAISELPLSDEDLEPLVDRYIEVLQELSTEIDNEEGAEMH